MQAEDVAAAVAIITALSAAATAIISAIRVKVGNAEAVEALHDQLDALGA